MKKLKSIVASTLIVAIATFFAPNLSATGCPDSYYMTHHGLSAPTADNHRALLHCFYIGTSWVVVEYEYVTIWYGTCWYWCYPVDINTPEVPGII